MENKYPKAGPRGAALMKVTNTKKPTRAILQCVSELRREVNNSDAPIDVWKLAEHLDIKVNLRHLDTPGFILHHPDDRFEVIIDKKMSKEKQTFTLAHELGHYIFFKRVPASMKGLTAEDDDPQEESLCNLAASELLMPLEYVIRDVKSMKFGPKAVFNLANKYNVSRSAMLYRLKKAMSIITGERLGLILWDKGVDDFFIPKIYSPNARISPVIWDNESSVTRAFLDKCEVPGKEIFNINGIKRTYESSSWRFGKQDKVLSLYWSASCNAEIRKYLDPDVSMEQRMEKKRVANREIQKIRAILA